MLELPVDEGRAYGLAKRSTRISTRSETQDAQVTKWQSHIDSCRVRTQFNPKTQPRQRPSGMHHYSALYFTTITSNRVNILVKISDNGLIPRVPLIYARLQFLSGESLVETVKKTRALMTRRELHLFDTVEPLLSNVGHCAIVGSYELY
jgi:hypothetical protein